MSWLTFVLLALVLIFAVQGFRKGMLRMAISMVFFLMVLGVTSWLNPYISDFVRAGDGALLGLIGRLGRLLHGRVLLEQLEGRDDLQSITGQVSYIEELPLPQTVKDKLMENNNTEIYKRLAVESFADYLGKYLSYGIINAICFLISFAIATILMYMILYAVDILTALPVIGTLNRIGGVCIGCIQGMIWIWVIFLIITIICDTPAGIYLQGQIRLDPILTWIYDNNMLMKIVLQIFG